jgi:KDO2-lipid IV(A) lauroyltransferase
VDKSINPTDTTAPDALKIERHAPATASLLLALTEALARLPFSIRSALGWILGYLVGLLPIRERTFARLQLQVFLPDLSAKRITPLVFANAGQTLLESLNVSPILSNRASRITCDSWDQVQAWTNEPRPIVCLTGHTGNWDLLAAWVISKGIPLTTIGREARKPSAQAVLKAIRDGYGIETIWRSDRSGLKRLVSCLKERRVLAALIDQDTRVESVSIPFFGQMAKTPVSLITLGRKMNARFVTAFIFRTGWLRFSVFVDEVPDLKSSEEILALYSQRLENLIRRYPAQWVWFHKRWRSPNSQVTLSSKEYEIFLRNLLPSGPNPSTRL